MIDKRLSLLFRLENTYNVKQVLCFSLDIYILISILTKIPYTFRNYPHLKPIEVPNGKNVDNALKINDYGKTSLFCKYLRDKSSDLYEILNLSINERT